MDSRSGIGIDVHPLIEGRALILGGLAIPFNQGLAGHSDGDVLIHAVIDALLGAAGLGDIGVHFPPGDPQYKSIRSTTLLSQTLELLDKRRWRTEYVDATILAERPTLRPFIGHIKKSLTASLNLDCDSVNLKATSTDSLGFVGRGEGIACLAIATLRYVR